MAITPPKPIVILGCTASGKSDLAEALATELGGRANGSPLPVMAVDSMQVYRGMDIGTAKPDAATRARIPYRMLDVVDPWETYSAARFVADARGHLSSEHPGAPRAAPILVAGTILYLRALIEGLFEGPSGDEAIRAELQQRAAAEGAPKLHEELARFDPLAASRIHANDLRRVVRALEVYRLTGMPISTLQTQWANSRQSMAVLYIGIRWEKELLNRRINARVKKMLEMGLIDEVRELASDPRGFSEEAQSAVGYRQLLAHFAGKCSMEEAIEQIKIQTRYLAKMQRTWLKRWPPPPPHGEIHWLDAAEGVESADLVAKALSVIDADGRA